MSHIHFVGGEKGGVGKSVFSRVFAQYLIDRSLPFAGIDGDLSHGALVRYYAEFTQSVDLSDNAAADQIVDRALGAERRVLVDLPAQSIRTLSAWLSEANVLDLARDMGVGVSFWHVTDGGFASLAEIERAFNLLNGEVRHLVVKNQGRSKDFSQFADSDLRRRLEDAAGRELELPELEAGAMYKIDRFGASFWAAVHRVEGEHALKTLERQRVQLWLNRCYSELDRVDAARA